MTAVSDVSVPVTGFERRQRSRTFDSRLGKHFFEGFRPSLGFYLVVAIGLQFIRRDWIVLGFEYFIEVTKSSTRVTAHRSVFVSAVAYILSLPLWLLSLFVVWVLVSVPVVVWYPLE